MCFLVLEGSPSILSVAQQPFSLSFPFFLCKRRREAREEVLSFPFLFFFSPFSFYTTWDSCSVSSVVDLSPTKGKKRKSKKKKELPRLCII